MMHGAVQGCVRLIVLLIGLLGMAAPLLPAVEPYRQFLDGLKAKGYHDEALLYLDRMRASELVPSDFKSAVDYERGLTLVEQAARIRDPSVRDRTLDDARAAFKEFLSANPQHPLSPAAGNQLANILVERARGLLLRATQQPAEKESLRGQARGLLSEAENMFTAALENASAQLAQFDQQHGKLIPDTETALIQQRDRLRTDRLQAELLSAKVVQELAQTAEPKTPEHRRYLTQAAEKFNALYKTNSKRLGGLYARMYEGRCYQELGETTKAIDVYSELLAALGDVQDFKQLRIKTLRYALECWVQTRKWSDAFERVSPLIDTLPAEPNDPDWVAVRYLTAVTVQQYAEKVEKGPQRKNRLADARQIATEVAQIAGEFQQPARTLLAQLGAKPPAEKAETEEGAFEKAFEAGKSAVEEREGTIQAIGLAKQNNAAAIPEMEKQLAKQTQTALSSLQAALRLSNTSSPIDMVNQTRYLIAYLSFQQGRYHDAAAGAEFVAAKFSQSSVARPCAEIALTSFQMLRQAEGADTAFADRQTERVASLIVAKWPKEELAGRALNVLIDGAIRRADIKQAAGFLDQVPADSPVRAEAEIRLGHALWAEYVRRSQEQTGGADAEIKGLVEQAQQRLERGIAGLRKAPKPPDLAPLAGLWLSQIYLNTSQAEKALALLEDEKLGPLALLDQGHRGTKVQGYAADVYMTALRTYVSVDPQQIEKATAMLDQLENSVGPNPEDSEQLIRRLMAMGKSLENELKELRAANNNQRVVELSEGFHRFLEVIVKKTDSFNSLNWAASTYIGLANGLAPAGSSLPPQAVTYFERAADAYQKALEKAPDADTALAVRIRMAATQRDARKFKEATDSLVAILKERPQMLAAQVEAAYTYQGRADSGDKPAYYYGLAIQGGRQGAIWGWGRISVLTANNPKLANTFHEARYNLALCRYLQATVERSDDSEKQLKIAKDEIAATFSRQPAMGGPDRLKQYDDLLRKIQTALGGTANGLDEFRAAPAP